MITSNPGLKALFLASAAAAVVVGAVAPAQAQAQAGNPAASADQPRPVHIEAQPLETAIQALSEQTDAVIVASGVVLTGRRSPTVSGVMSAPQALTELLRGSDLAFRAERGGAYVIVRRAPHVAPQASAADAVVVEEVVVTGFADPLARLQTSATDSFLGLDRSLLETPRSASRVSAETIERYGMRNVDDLIAAVPGAFTASFFGVPGNLNVRGTLADTYFQGFKRIENRGSFSSNLGAAAYVEVLRGPSSPIYGPGKVGGLLNFVPRTARGDASRYVQSVQGGMNITAGSYGQFNAAANVVVPLGQGGLALYVEREDSDSYYENIHPEHLNLQGTYVGDLGGGWTTEINAMYFKESGRIQSPGWNRVTQALIDDGTYITGRDTDLSDTNGSGYLEYSEIDAVLGAYGGTSNIRQLLEYGGKARPEYALDEGVGTTTLSGRKVMATQGDYNDSETLTAYAAVERRMSNGAVLSFKGFMDEIENQRFNSFGFAADYWARAIEGRITYAFPFSVGSVRADTIVGVSYRDHEAKQYESFLSGYLGSDRRDLSRGATATDRIAAPNIVNGEVRWDSRHEMEWTAKSAFLMTDIALFDRLSLLAGLRHDSFDVQAVNNGVTVFGSKGPASNSDGATTWSLSLRYETPFGVTPYVTVAEPRSLESTQTGGVSVGSVLNNTFISPSKLQEAGVKFSLFNGNLFGSAAYYEQWRRQMDALGNISGTTSEGFEAEVHWLASDRLSFTSALTLQETRVDAPGAGKGEYLQVRPEQFGVDPVLGYGGIFGINNAGTLVELRNGYKVATMPDTVASLFGTYTTPWFSLGARSARMGFTAGATYVSETGGIMKSSVRLPAYTLARAAAFLEVDGLTLSANVDNLFDERYFTPSAEVYKEVAVMPGLPRMFRVNLAYRF